jgi:hypothetical protein
MGNEGRGRGWIGVLGPPAWLRGQLLAGLRALGERLRPWPIWVALGIVLGAGPPGLDYLLGTCTHRWLTVLGVAPFFLSALVHDWQGRGMGLLACLFVAHNVLMIVLAAHDPAGLAVVCGEGPDYWQKSRAWIATGACPDYERDWWIPAHFQLLGAVVVLSYASLGLVTVGHGLYEVDLMNFYVGRLLAQADAFTPALLLGWHPWSACRGVGFLLVTYEVASLSLSRLTGWPLSTGRRRRARWALGLTFLLGDGLIKFFLMEPIRQVLAGHLS